VVPLHISENSTNVKPACEAPAHFLTCAVALQDPQFKKLVSQRWRALRGQELSNTALQRLLNSTVAQMGTSAERTFNRFREVVPPFRATDWKFEVSRMQHFITKRLAWMDDALAASLI
jgi:hypothetical protein